MYDRSHAMTEPSPSRLLFAALAIQGVVLLVTVPLYVVSGLSIPGRSLGGQLVYPAFFGIAALVTARDRNGMPQMLTALVVLLMAFVTIGPAQYLAAAWGRQRTRTAAVAQAPNSLQLTTTGGSVKKWIVLLMLCVPLASASAQQARTGVRPVASVRQLHDLMITPASDAVFHAGGDTPTTDGAWLDARNQAMLLAESGNLLMLGSRARDTARWMSMSRALVDAAATAATAADRKDAETLAAAGDAITAACQACHQPYRDGGRQMGVPK